MIDRITLLIKSESAQHEGYSAQIRKHEGSFYLEKEKKKKAELTYSKAGTSQIIIDFTEVADELQGQDVGRKLVEHAVDYARETNLKVIPLCPFAKSIIERDESLQDVQKNETRL